MKHNYKIFGEKPVEIVIEMGLGSCMSEWFPMARQLSQEYGVLVYERAGINKSAASTDVRTPKNIAQELYHLLNEVEHCERIILIAHSQGGLYAQQFCRLYPDLVEMVVLLYPLSAEDSRFKEKLTKKEYERSGVDKSLSFRVMKIFAKLKLGFVAKKMLKNAPPIYYYDGFSEEERNDILGCTDSVIHASTVLDEYYTSHDPEAIKGLAEKDGFPNIPLILITHTSELAIEENMKFGNNTKEFAEKIEGMWQEIMKGYLKYSDKSRWIQAKNSTHYIHLQEPEIIIRTLKDVKSCESSATP